MAGEPPAPLMLDNTTIGGAGILAGHSPLYGRHIWRPNCRVDGFPPNRKHGGLLYSMIESQAGSLRHRIESQAAPRAPPITGTKARALGRSNRSGYH